MQTMKGLKEETREVFRRFPNYKLSQSNAARLSRLEPEKQKTAAILLASYQIKSVDEYEPEQIDGKATRKPKQDKEFLESVASLKDPTKAALDGSRRLVSDYRTMVYKVQQQVRSCHDPYFKKTVSALTQSELDELEQLTDSCCELMRDFIGQLKEAFTHPHG